MEWWRKLRLPIKTMDESSQYVEERDAATQRVEEQDAATQTSPEKEEDERDDGGGAARDHPDPSGLPRAGADDPGQQLGTLAHMIPHMQPGQKANAAWQYIGLTPQCTPERRDSTLQCGLRQHCIGLEIY
jgi:hypothetical protein